ncbi:hypothetical protein GOBAR_AA18712 [Gossypium barbadense]|uniref:Uncharacterized protein n=1 Tax=Gossypium barbadense TaxID=3634 RepID=A0A2P5XF69_GOSBA|nr:hypothetical protein GOBAR_AA18712 [Gossypium barbadense]
MEFEEDDDLGTMMAIYCPHEMENLSLVELFAEITEPGIQVVILASQLLRDPNDDFSDPDLDDIIEDIGEEGPMEGENANPNLAGNTGPGIVIRNNPGYFMTDVDLDAALAASSQNIQTLADSPT